MNRVKELRKINGFSQQKLAKELNVHQTAISQWETGRTSPDIEVASEMAQLFNVSLEYLLGISDDSTTTKKLLTETDEEPDKNIVTVRGRDGSYSKKHLTDEQIAMLKTMIDSLPDVPDDL